MFIQLEELYINVDNIVALGVFEMPNKDNTGYQMGIILNGEKYTVYTVQGASPDGLRQELHNNMRAILSQIIAETQQKVVKVSIPRPNLEQYKQVQEEQESKPEKEQIND